MVSLQVNRFRANTKSKCYSCIQQFFAKEENPKNKLVENGGIDPPTSRMLSERSTI